MRLLFLCSGLEPGRDGVGDYTRRLAAEGARLGYECRLVSLNDKTAAETGEPELLRCPETAPWSDRADRVRELVEAFRPDWISLQFVPYGFQRKGIPWRLTRDLRKITAGYRLQIMFHELWIGSAENASAKHRVVGVIQRFCILRMIRELRPAVIHTSNLTYIRLLQNAGVCAELLPLFGNIPVTTGALDFPKELTDAGIAASERDRWWFGVFFGTLHPQWEPQPFLGILLSAARKAGRRVGLIAVGRLGGVGEAIWETMRRDHGREIVFVNVGEQPGERISEWMRIADFGVASSPWNLIGKSGSAAAMLDHGLPVIVTRREEIAGIEGSADPLLYRCDATLEAKFAEGLGCREPASRAPEIAAQFLSSLQKTASGRKG